VILRSLSLFLLPYFGFRAIFAGGTNGISKQLSGIRRPFVTILRLALV
jgi:hypothetical protein